MTRLRVFADAEELGVALADEIAAAYAAKNGAFLLGCPAGRSLLTTYRALPRRLPDASRLVVVMMDDYLGVAADEHHSARRFARDELAIPLGLGTDQVWIPDAADPGAYDARIAAAGGIDVFLVGSGASDGHVAFVAPGSPRERGTAVVALAESTRRDNLATFPAFRMLDDVPTHGVSVGLRTIMSARTLRLVLLGRQKRGAAARVLELDGFDPGWPASIVHEHDDAEIWADREAVG